MPEKNRNRLKQKAIASLARGVSETPSDQMGKVIGINNGTYNVRLDDGSVIRSVTRPNTLTNAGFAINDPVYVVPREGVALIDAPQTVTPQFNQVESLQQISSS